MEFGPCDGPRGVARTAGRTSTRLRVAPVRGATRVSPGPVGLSIIARHFPVLDKNVVHKQKQASASTAHVKRGRGSRDRLDSRVKSATCDTGTRSMCPDLTAQLGREKTNTILEFQFKGGLCPRVTSPRGAAHPRARSRSSSDASTRRGQLARGRRSTLAASRPPRWSAPGSRPCPRWCRSATIADGSDDAFSGSCAWKATQPGRTLRPRCL